MEALPAIAFAVLPGAVFVFAMERVVGAWGVKASDRVLRFISLSAIPIVLLLPYGYSLYGKFVRHGYIQDARPFPYGHWLLLIVLLGVLPAVLGTWAGRAIDKNNEWVGQLFGHQMRPPRAFDHVFKGQPTGYVKLLVNLSGTRPTWIAGAFSTEGDHPADQAYVAGFPESPDIYLPIRLRCNPRTGEFITDANGNPMRTEERGQRMGILINGSQIAYLEFQQVTRLPPAPVIST